MTDFVEQVYRFHEPASADAEPLNLNALLDNTLILIRSQMKDQGVMLNDERAKSIPSVELPPAAVMQVLLQPVRNAVQAMPRGGNLTFRTAVDPAGVRVEIADSGPGIPESFLPRIFEPFASFRHEGSPNDCVGLGLTVALHILTEIGGTIAVSSPDGQGTRVQIVFPLTMKPFEKDLLC
jgi:two-component system NtrC family sensor kinase